MIKNTALDNAFAELESIGYFARRNWECCNTCGWYLVPEDKKDTCIFIHSQAEDSLEDYGSTYANWSGNARIIVGILEKHGVMTDGVPDEDTKIRIFAEDERTDEEVEADYEARYGNE